MPDSLYRLPKNLIKEWPEIFEDLYMNTMPLAYLDYIYLEFANGRVWEINIKEKLKDEDSEKIAGQLLETLREFSKELKNIDFKFNVDQLKNDIKKSTDDLLK